MAEGIPTLTICTDSFKPLAERVSSGLGVRDLPLVIIPHPLVGLTDEAFASRVATAWQQVSPWLAFKLTPEASLAETHVDG